MIEGPLDRVGMDVKARFSGSGREARKVATMQRSRHFTSFGPMSFPVHTCTVCAGAFAFTMLCPSMRSEMNSLVSARSAVELVIQEEPRLMLSQTKSGVPRLLR